MFDIPSDSASVDTSLSQCPPAREHRSSGRSPTFIPCQAREPRARSVAVRPHQPTVHEPTIVESVTTNTKPAILFMCVHNAGRSQMAAGWLRHLAGDSVDVYSGGSEPGANLNPMAVQAMAEIGIDITSEFPKLWTDKVVRAADVVVSMGCGDTCSFYLGKRYDDWELTDPAGQPIELVREVRDDIGERVRRLMTELGVPLR